MKQQRKHALLRIVLIVCALCLLALLAFWGSSRVAGDLSEQAQSSLKSTVLQYVVECYAIEGTYPPNLAYLEKNYGLVYNKKDFVVSYEIFASNEPPSVTVLVRGAS